MASPNHAIALFGGTFDPVHEGHLYVAEEAQRQLDLREIVFVPCYQSPHKPEVETASGPHRFAMLEIALADTDWATVSDFEISQPRPSFSWETATHFVDVIPKNSEIFWLLGADQWAVIETWTRPEVLADLVTFLVVPRDGADAPSAKSGFRSIVLEGRFDASGTEIRAALESGSDDVEALPDGVSAYIARNALYGIDP